MALKISPTWLKSYCNINASTEEIADILSQTGFETEVIDDLVIDPMLVVGHIISVHQHPNADKLNICQVNVNEEILQIVCGCPTVTHAKRVIVAPINSSLPGMTLKPVSLRGVESQGMLCSLKEIGISDDASGIHHITEDAPAGTRLVDLLKHDQKILEIDITPNRGDCLSVYGIARDLASSQDLMLQAYPDGESMQGYVATDTLFNVKSSNIIAYDALTGSFYPMSATPLYIVNRLRQAGMGTNHVVVDILNYIMLELGQPMHAFNAQALSLPLQIEDGGKEVLKLLDDTIYQPRPWDLIISDQKEPHALAGIMGGYASRMQSDSTTIQLESAVFNPRGIAKSLRNCPIGSDASYRYERGVSPDLNQKALSYTAKLLRLYTKAEFSEYQSYHTGPQMPVIPFNALWINRYLGTNIAESLMIEILERLGMTVKNGHATPPSYRYDIHGLEDLVEEVARVYGYNNIPLEPMQGSLVPVLQSTSVSQKTKMFMVQHGYHEVVQFSFVSKELLKIFPDDCEAVEISNPIHSEFGFMRTNLLQSLVIAAQYNYQRQINHFRLFEVGESFQITGSGIEEKTEIAAICVGHAEIGYDNRNQEVDYYDMQRMVFALLKQYGITTAALAESNHRALHPKQSSQIVYQSKVIGQIGILHPATQKTLGLPKTGIISIQLDKLRNQTTQEIKLPSRFPSIRRDITVKVSINSKASDIEYAINKANIPNLAHLEIVDVYYDAEDRDKSLTWSLTFQSMSHTLTDKDIESAIDEIKRIL